MDGHLASTYVCRHGRVSLMYIWMVPGCRCPCLMVHSSVSGCDGGVHMYISAARVELIFNVDRICALVQTRRGVRAGHRTHGPGWDLGPSEGWARGPAGADEDVLGACRSICVSMVCAIGSDTCAVRARVSGCALCAVTGRPGVWCCPRV